MSVKKVSIYDFMESDNFKNAVTRTFPKELEELIKDHKSNWIPDSKGGEPNCKKEADNGND